MFASHLLSTIIQGIRPVQASQQPIELQPGQVFRGVIMRAFPNQMVQVQLPGTVLYAQLNAPLEVGQAAWLQVLPKSHPITLKVIDAPRQQAKSSTGSSDATESEGLLRSIGMKADQVNVQNLQKLVKLGIPLKMEDIQRLLDTLRNSQQTEKTLQMIQLAHHRGLPTSAEVIRSLEAVFFHSSFEELIHHLKLQGNQNPNAQLLIQRAAHIWQEARAQLEHVPSNAMYSSTNAVASTTEQVQVALKNQSVTSSQSLFTNRSQQENVSPKQPLPTIEIKNASFIPEPHEELQPKQLGDLAVQKQTTNTPHSNGLMNFFKLLGIDFEQSMLTNMGQAEEANVALKQETLNQLKGVLLELKSLDNITPALRDTIEHGIRMITGQQLLLVNDHNAHWSSFIFQVPLHQQSEQLEPSFIHIEGRKKGRESIDIENCRLFFHLDLESIQKTLIDIQITNRIMSIQLYNDLPDLKAWIDEQREDWVSIMKVLDYTLSSIKVLPLPKTEDEGQHVPTLPLQRTSYQGVDVRV